MQSWPTLSDIRSINYITLLNYHFLSRHFYRNPGVQQPGKCRKAGKNWEQILCLENRENIGNFDYDCYDNYHLYYRGKIETISEHFFPIYHGALDFFHLT
uniref:Uncharacterized protein n=1 Tax=Romanomermis culicivorax TaxID=13658 RepID=A0A915KTA2_ROMCU